VIAAFEGRKKHAVPIPLGRTSPYPPRTQLTGTIKSA
jgi:hypothetical protein